MGSGTSSLSPPVSDKSNNDLDLDLDDQIDVIALFSGLFKLSPVFDVNETLTQSLRNEITTKHSCLDDQFIEVQKWVMKYGCDALTTKEIFQLIKYVELYHHNHLRLCDKSFYELNTGDFTPPNLSNNEPLEEASAFGAGSLMCPFRSDFASWTAAIRAAELVQFFDHDANSTILLENLESSKRTGDESTSRLRCRGNSDMSDLSV